MCVVGRGVHILPPMGQPKSPEAQGSTKEFQIWSLSSYLCACNLEAVAHSKPVALFQRFVFGLTAGNICPFLPA